MFEMKRRSQSSRIHESSPCPSSGGALDGGSGGKPSKKPHRLGCSATFSSRNPSYLVGGLFPPTDHPNTVFRQDQIFKELLRARSQLAMLDEVNRKRKKPVRILFEVVWIAVAIYYYVWIAIDWIQHLWKFSVSVFLWGSCVRDNLWRSCWIFPLLVY